MLLSLGTKGYRALQPNSSTKLYLPKVNRSSRAVIDMWIKAKELEANTDYYIELLANGIGKSKEELAKDIQRPKYFQALEAIEYGIADKIIDSRDAAFDKRNFPWIRIMMRCLPNQGPRGGLGLVKLQQLHLGLGERQAYFEFIDKPFGEPFPYRIWCCTT